MTKKEQISFDNFRKHCQTGETALLLGADFVAMDKLSFQNKISKADALKLLHQTFNDILEIYWEQPNAENTSDLKVMIERRFVDLLSKP